MIELNTLSAISPIDGRYASRLESLRDFFSEFALMKYRLIVEIEWFRFLSDCPDIRELPELDKSAQQYLDKLINDFNLQEVVAIKAFEKETNHDLKAVEYYLKSKFNQHAGLKPLKEFIHFSCTSDDINNLAYALMIKAARESLILPKMEKLTEKLKEKAHQFAETPLLGRTHGKAATPSTMGKEFANFVNRLLPQFKRFSELPIYGKLNGAVGNFNAHAIAYPDIDWPSLSKQFIESLHLENNAYTTQIEPHDYIADLALTLNHFNTILIDFCRDIWAYISLDYFQQSIAEKEVGSSTMPHKVNPIDFENAEGNLGLANALLLHFAQKLPISRLQRDLSDSTVMRNIGCAFAYALISFDSISKGLDKLILNKEKLSEELNTHWEVIAEVIQTIMRQHGMQTPYEQLKTLTRGKKVTQADMQKFIDTLELPLAAKEKLKQLTPENYIGFAAKLAKSI